MESSKCSKLFLTDEYLDIPPALVVVEESVGDETGETFEDNGKVDAGLSGDSSQLSKD